MGLTTALAALAGTEAEGGYALPMDAGIRRVVEVLRRGEEVEYGFLGVSPGLHPFRRVVTRYERRVDLYDGLVHLACAFIALGRLVK